MERELNFLAENYKKYSINELSIKLGRSKNSVSKKMSRLNLFQTKWTKDEENYLKQNYERKTNYELAELLGRSVDGVSHRLMKLKLKRSKQVLSAIWIKTHKDFKEGKEHHLWKGGKRIGTHGYVWIYCPEHPFATKKYVREHRLVMEKVIKRFLKPEEVVHHINGVKDDNRPENLMLLPNEKEHGKLHYQLKKENNHINILGRFKKIEQASLMHG